MAQGKPHSISGGVPKVASPFKGQCCRRRIISGLELKATSKLNLLMSQMGKLRLRESR